MQYGQSRIDAAFQNFIDSLTQADICKLQSQFSKKPLVCIADILPENLWLELSEEASNLVEHYGKRKSLVVKETSDTERNMITVGNTICRENSPLIAAIYDSRPFRRFLSHIAGEIVHQCPIEDEQIAISLLERKGDTHGWHWDDFSFGLVWLIDIPDASCGGFTQCIHNTKWDKKNPAVYDVITNNAIESYHFNKGGFYFFKSGTTLHRVHPLTKDSRRLIVNMDWASTSDLEIELSIETTLDIYS